MNSKALLFILGIGLVAAACDDGEGAPATDVDEAAPKSADSTKTKAEPEPEPEPEPLPKVDDQTKTEAAKLAKLRDGRLYPDDTLEKSNARAFLWLAATAEEPDPIIAALEAIERTWTSTEDHEERETVDGDYLMVVRKHLASADPKVLDAALSAVRNGVRSDGIDAATLDALGTIVTSHESVGARYKAVDTLGNLSHDHPRLGALLLEGMDGSQADVVVSKSLDRIPFVTNKLSSRDEVMKRAMELTSHDNPGIRGNAAKSLGDLATDEEHDQIRPKLEAMLADSHPYVRAAALGGLGRLKDPRAIEAIIGLLGDSEKGTFEIEGWKTLAGHAGRMHHQGGAWFRVDRMALQALRDCTWRMGDKAFKHDKIDFKNEDKDIAKAVKQAKAWYKKHRASLKTG